MAEMSQGLADDDEPVAENQEDAPCVRPTKPKTRKQKLKAKVLRMKEIRRKKLKELKKRMMELER